MRSELHLLPPWALQPNLGDERGDRVQAELVPEQPWFCCTTNHLVRGEARQRWLHQLLPDKEPLCAQQKGRWTGPAGPRAPTGNHEAVELEDVCAASLLSRATHTPLSRAQRDQTRAVHHSNCREKEVV